VDADVPECEGVGELVVVPAEAGIQDVNDQKPPFGRLLTLKS
jgi:hypothetical protein